VSIPEVGPDERCIGVALAVPEPYGDWLAAARSRVGDPAAASIPPHVTLLMPTAVRLTDVGLVDEHLAQVAAQNQPFVVRLHGSATFRPVSPVVYVQVVAGAEGCERLADGVRRGPLAQDLRFPYHPHVTVAQRLPDDVLDAALVEMSGFDATFDVTSFQRYEHGEDGVWRVVRTFALGS